MNLRLLLMPMLLWTINIDARTSASPQAIIIKQIKGELYQQTRHQWPQITSLDEISDQQLPPAKWHDIIRNGDPELAKALLAALGELLDRRDFLPYAFSGLNRAPDPATRPSQTVANKAYQVYSHYGDLLTNMRLRTHIRFRHHLEPDVLWKRLFDTHEVFSSTQEAINYLKDPLRDFTGSNDDLLSKAIRTLALHNDVNDLELWMKDDHFAVALGSWLALARIKPLVVANDIMDHALWWQDGLTYQYGSGCVVNSSILTPAQAALEIFSDYLTPEHIAQVFKDVPEFNNDHALTKISINNHALYKAMKNKFTDAALSNRLIGRFDLQYSPLTLDKLENFFANDELGFLDTRGVPFNQVVLQYVRQQLSKAHEDFDPFQFVFWAFEDKSAHAKQYISDLMQARISSAEQQELAEELLTYYPIWPTDWLDLKQQNVVILQAMSVPPERLSLHLY